MGTDEIESVACDLCGADQPDLLFPTHTLPNGSAAGVVRCQGCELTYRNVRRVESSERQHYVTHDYSELSPNWIAGRKRAFLSYLGDLQPYRQCNTILDVGAGQGFFLSVCAQQGWKCSGIEISPEACAFAKQELGLELTCATLDEARFPDGQFDVVSYWNCLDQLPSPKSALRETYRILCPGGAVMARFPNASFHVPVHRLFQRGGQFLDKLCSLDVTILHLYAFNKATITQLLHDTGYSDVTVRNAPLSWTSRPNDPVSLDKRAVARLVYTAAQVTAGLSAKKLLVSPSLFVTAKKTCM